MCDSATIKVAHAIHLVIAIRVELDADTAIDGRTASTTQGLEGLKVGGQIADLPCVGTAVAMALAGCEALDEERDMRRTVSQAKRQLLPLS